MLKLNLNGKSDGVANTRALFLKKSGVTAFEDFLINWRNMMLCVFFVGCREMTGHLLLVNIVQ